MKPNKTGRETAIHLEVYSSIHTVIYPHMVTDPRTRDTMIQHDTAIHLYNAIQCIGDVRREIVSTNHPSPLRPRPRGAAAPRRRRRGMPLDRCAHSGLVRFCEIYLSVLHVSEPIDVVDWRIYGSRHRSGVSFRTQFAGCSAQFITKPSETARHHSPFGRCCLKGISKPY